MDQKKYKVVLNMYDLSQGMAKQFSPIFLGKQIDAIWHTGLVVYGKEYYFGGGICAGQPKQTLYGYPIEEREIGETEVPQEVFEEHLRSISNKYTAATYDLFTNNCNNFTNECAQFLLSKDIPEHIIGLPQEFLNTQLGQMLKPFIEQMTNKATNDQASEHFDSLGPLASPPLLVQNQQPQPPQQPPQQQKPQPEAPKQAASQPQEPTNVVPIEDLETFLCIIESSPKCVIDFYTEWCGPCKRIKPLFNKLSIENQDIQFFNVNVEKVKEVAQQLQVHSVPTFMIYKDGAQIDRWAGGDQVQLTNKVNGLK